MKGWKAPRGVAGAVALGCLAMGARGGELRVDGTFASPEDFGKRAAAFRPAESDGFLKRVFSAENGGEDPKSTQLVAAEKVAGADVLWSDDERAALFLTAEPPTTATRTEVGVLVWLVKTGKSEWRIEDLRRWQATGKDCGVKCELTAGANEESALGTEFPIVLTVTESQGGHGYGYEASESWRIIRDRIERQDLE